MNTIAVVFALVAIAGATLAAVLAAAESSLVSPDPEPPSSQRKAPGESAARERQYRALSFARIGAQLIAGAAGALALRGLGMPGSVFVAIVIVGAILLATVTEGAARTLVTGRAGATRQLAPLVRLIAAAFSPMGGLDARADRALATILPPLEPDEAEREATDQFREIVSSEATITRDEADLITGVFSLAETPVREVMVPRVDILGIDRSLPWSEMLDRVRSSEHARFPVFDETLDDVVGILFSKDLLHSVITDTPPVHGWPSLLREPTFIPATKAVDQQLRDFQAGGTQIAIVVDEYGGTAGLVTIEDILEEIVGEIRDEYDDEDAPIEQRDGRRFWVSGRVPVHELGEALDHEFEHEESTTVGGLIYERLGRVPRSGEQLTVDGFRVVVERVVRRRVERVYFERVGDGAGRSAR
jgi:CBS domain containing-hemolysin-like protein